MKGGWSEQRIAREASAEPSTSGTSGAGSEEAEVLDEEFQHEIEGVVAPTPRGSKDIMSYSRSQYDWRSEGGRGIDHVIISNNRLIIRR